MEQQQNFEDSLIAPSFSCYSTDSITSTTIAKVIREQQLAQFHENGAFEGEDFEFSVLSDAEVSAEEIDSRGWTVFKRDLMVNDHKNDASSSYSSTEGDELESPPSIPKGKKSSSTGSGSKRWIFRYLLRWSNNEGKQPKMMDSPKQKRYSGEVLKVGGRWKAQTPVHEFYMQRRAENEVGKKKSYLPYRKDLVGLFANVNGMGKILSF